MFEGLGDLCLLILCVMCFGDWWWVWFCVVLIYYRCLDFVDCFFLVAFVGTACAWITLCDARVAFVLRF